MQVKEFCHEEIMLSEEFPSVAQFIKRIITTTKYVLQIQFAEFIKALANQKNTSNYFCCLKKTVDLILLRAKA